MYEINGKVQSVSWDCLQIACGSGLELIYDFLHSKGKEGGSQGVKVRGSENQSTHLFAPDPDDVDEQTR